MNQGNQRGLNEQRMNLGMEEPRMGMRNGIDDEVVMERFRFEGNQVVQETIGDCDVPFTSPTRMGIRCPQHNLPHFEIKPGLIGLIQSARYFGLNEEDPIEHLYNFERFCGTVKMEGVHEDLVKLTLFSFSLEDKASLWERSVISSTITTWEECKKRFLERFYSHKRTTKYRTEIASFKQGVEETFGEAWERFSGYVRRCPHHGFTRGSLLQIFHRGVHGQFRLAMNTASNGSFSSLSIEQGEKLVENLARAYHDENDLENPSRWNHQRIEEMRAKVEKLEKEVVIHQKERDTTRRAPREKHEKVYLVEEGYQGNHYQESSPRGINEEKASMEQTQPKDNETYILLKRFLVEQNHTKRDLKEMLEMLKHKNNECYMELKERYEALESHVKNMEHEIAEQASKIESQKGRLPGKCEVNPKEYCQSISLRSGKQLPPRTRKENPEEDEEKVETVPMEEELQGDNQDEETPMKPKENPNQQEKATKFVATPRPRREKKNEPTHTDTDIPIDELNLPFPGRFKKQILAAKLKRIEDHMRGVEVTIPFMEWCQDNPVVNKVLRDIVTKKKRIDTMMMMMEQESSESTQDTKKSVKPLESKSILKEGDSFKSIEPCSFGEIVKEDALCDAKAKEDAVSCENTKSEKFKDAKDSSTPIMLVDSSTKATPPCVIPNTVKGIGIRKVTPNLTHFPIMTLTPNKCVDGVIDYKVKCDGFPKPFAKVKVIVTEEMKEQGNEGIDALMKKILVVELHDPPWKPKAPPWPTLPKA